MKNQHLNGDLCRKNGKLIMNNTGVKTNEPRLLWRYNGNTNGDTNRVILPDIYIYICHYMSLYIYVCV